MTVVNFLVVLGLALCVLMVLAYIVMSVFILFP
jgi:hypothetical protein